KAARKIDSTLAASLRGTNEKSVRDCVALVRLSDPFARLSCLLLLVGAVHDAPTRRVVSRMRWSLRSPLLEAHGRAIRRRVSGPRLSSGRVEGNMKRISKVLGSRQSPFPTARAIVAAVACASLAVGAQACIATVDDG